MLGEDKGESCWLPDVKILLAPMFLPSGILHVTCDNTSSRYSDSGGSMAAGEEAGEGEGVGVGAASEGGVAAINSETLTFGWMALGRGCVCEGDVGRVLTALLISLSNASNTAAAVAVVVADEDALLVVVLLGVAPGPK